MTYEVVRNTFINNAIITLLFKIVSMIWIVANEDQVRYFS